MIEKAFLVQGALEKGIRLSRKQLSDWQLAGLIQPPELIYGAEGKRGVKAYYADDTLDRVIIITATLKQKRDLDAARLALWRAGYPVDIRPMLRQAIDELRLIRDLLNSNDFKALNNLRDNPLLHMLHKRGGGKVEYPSIAYLLWMMLSDEENFSALDPEEHTNPDKRIARALFGVAVSIPTLYDYLNTVKLHCSPNNLEEMAETFHDDALRASDREMKPILRVSNFVFNIPRLVAKKPMIDYINYEKWAPRFQLLAALFNLSIQTDGLLEKTTDTLVREILPKITQ